MWRDENRSEWFSFKFHKLLRLFVTETRFFIFKILKFIILVWKLTNNLKVLFDSILKSIQKYPKQTTSFSEIKNYHLVCEKFLRDSTLNFDFDELSFSHDAIENKRL